MRWNRFLRVLLSPLPLIVAACAPAAPPATSASAASAPVTNTVASQPHQASAPPQKERPEWLKQWFAVEESMGATCRPPGFDGTVEELPLQDANCSGRLPEHLAAFVRRILADGFLTDKERKHQELKQRIEEEQQYYKAVLGLGKRPDFLVDYGLVGFWVRSFEGPDPDTTVYLVHGPVCDYEEKGPHCLSESEELRNIRLYRTYKGGTPQDVTEELLPPAPTMTQAEKRRYGVYIRPKGWARDGDIKLDISRITYVPVLRWTVRPAHIDVEDFYHPQKSIPDSDPRVYKEYHRPDLHGNRNNVHYGFLVWNGERFELREKVPTNLWPCRIDWHDYTVNNRCGEGYDNYDSRMDRYLIQPSDNSSEAHIRSTAP